MPLLEVRGLERSFYGVQALRGADLTVEAGTITGLIGPNGAGKTTLFNCVSGLVPPDAGSVRFDGRDITGWRPDRISRRGLVRTFQIARGFPRLSVLENLLLYGGGQPGEGFLRALLRPPSVRRREEALRERAFAIARRLRLTRVLNDPASDLSGGQKKLLELGRALMASPALVMLDEPVAGVNPALAREIVEHLRALVAESITILLIEHHMDTVARLCDRVVVLAEGRHLAEGTFAALAADSRVQEAYMGRRPWGS
jgi:branched-chain amino acid transport system ATP-binding protein/neutral amino acid transport system ATP-binding protein